MTTHKFPPTPPCVPTLQAEDGQRDGLRAELQGQLQWLVANYSTRRASLLEEILPEVRVAVSSSLWHAAPEVSERELGHVQLQHPCPNPQSHVTGLPSGASCPALQPEDEPQEFDMAWCAAACSGLTAGGQTGDCGRAAAAAAPATAAAAAAATLLLLFLPPPRRRRRCCCPLGCVTRLFASCSLHRLGDFIDRLSEFDKEMNGVVIESGKLFVIC